MLTLVVLYRERRGEERRGASPFLAQERMGAMSTFFRGPLNLACPICGSPIHPTLEDVRLERTISCPRGHAVQLVDKDDGVAKLDRSMRDLQRSLRRLSRRR